MYNVEVFEAGLSDHRDDLSASISSQALALADCEVQEFTVYYCDMSGKGLECCMAISPKTLLLPSSSKYVY